MLPPNFPPMWVEWPQIIVDFTPLQDTWGLSFMDLQDRALLTAGLLPPEELYLLFLSPLFP